MSTNSNQPTVILWGVSVSPYVRKVMVALAEKNIAYEQREILPKRFLQALGQAVPVEFDAVSPLGKIPAIQIGQFTLSDSAVIAAYLDRKFSGGHQLYPADPETYARALWFEHYADTTMTDVIYKKMFLECVAKPKVLNQATDNKLVEEAKAELPPILDFLNQSLAETEWISGECFSMADVAIAVQLLALTITGFEIDAKRWPHLSAFMTKITQRPSFKKIISAGH